VDILLNDTKENRDRLARALYLVDIGKFENIQSMQFILGWTSINIGNNIELEIMTELKGVDESFEKCFEKASIAKIFNLEIPFLHINQLIQNKEAVNRPKDQIDLFEPKKLKELEKVIK
jgi:hypothetical protein